ncbi:MAG: MarR family winged helix-turn-helix transcriptional regulator [Paracoccaceae bacterium]
MNDAETQSEQTLAKQRLRLWLRLLRAHRSVENQLREKMRLAYGVTLPRFDVLSALDRYRDGLRMSDLSAKLMVSNGNVTGIVDRLEAEGLAERIAVDGDRRAMRVRLTQDGIDRFAEMAAEHETWVDGVLDGFDEAELDTMITLLKRLEEDQT